MRFEWLYSLQKEDNLKVYSKNPPGKLSVARLLRQLPAFEQRRVGFVPKPRELLVNIWTKHFDPVAVKRKLVELMQEGHKVYLPPMYSWMDADNVLLDDAWIESGVIDFRFSTKAANRFTGDHRHVLTHYDMERLLADDEDLKTSIVYADDFLGSRLAVDIDTLEPRSGRHGEPPTRVHQFAPDPEREKTSRITTRIICETFHTDRIWKISADGLSGETSDNRYEYEAAFHRAVLRDEDITELLQGHPLHKAPIDLKPEHLQPLRSLGYILPTHRGEPAECFYHYQALQHRGPDCADIAALLARTPNLENLMLGRIAHANTDWPTLPALTKLTVGYATNTASLFRLLAMTPNLKHLALRYTLPLNDATPLPPLPSIRSFKNSHEYVDPAVLSVLLEAMPGLRELVLSNSLTEKWNIPDMPRLKRLRTTGNICDSQTLATLLQNSPMLEEITHNGFGIQRFDQHDREQLIRALQRSPNLKTISVHSYFVHRYKEYLMPFWETILEHAPNLDAQTKTSIARLLERMRTEEAPSSSIAIGGIANGIAEFFTSGFRGGFGSGGVDISGMDWSRDGESHSQSSERIHTHTPNNHNAPFDPGRMRHHRPTAAGGTFQYSGRHEALNQIMVIDQYCRYLQLDGQDIPDIHDGICNALSHLCASKEPAIWLANLELLRDWDGERKSLTPEHQKLFGEIRMAIKTWQEMSLWAVVTSVLSGKSSRTWLGESAVDWLSHQTPGSAFILSNSWHAICVRRLDGVPAHFVVYNPSFDVSTLPHDAEQLATFLQQSLGDLSLVMVEGGHDAPNLSLSDPQTFIAKGGLFQTACARNNNELFELLARAKIPATRETLSGLFLRDLKGIPLWYSCLATDNQRLQAIVLRLLAHFMDQNPDTWWQQLAMSAGCIENFDLDETLCHLHQVFRNHDLSSSAVSEIPELVQARRMADEDTLRMQPENNTRNNVSLDDKLTALARSVKPSHLITVTNPEQVRLTRFALEARARATGRPVIYIDNPSDLTLSNPFVQMQDDGVTGLFQKGPGGRIYDALKTAQRPLIIVNYDNFPPASRVSFNALFDDVPMADGVELPAGSTVVALQNLTNTALYKGSDMSSRFAERALWEEPTGAWPALPVVPVHTQEQGNEEGIELYQGADWKERLLGTWSPRGDRLVWMEGELAQALQRSRHLRIQNAPLQDPEYADFWREAVDRGWIMTERGKLDLPNGFSLRETTGFDWDALADCVGSLQGGMDPACPHILNASTLEDFLTHYTCDDASETLHADENHLETRFGRNSRHTINLSHTVCPGDLARFLTACQARNITVDLRCAEGVILPDSLAARKTAAPVQAEIVARDHTRLILSNDSDAACAMARAEGVLVIDLSECEAGHLIDTIDGALDPEGARLRFKNRNGLLPPCLQAGQTLVLTGIFSDDVVETLTPLLLARYGMDNAPGNLVLIPRNAKDVALPFLPALQHVVTLDEKRQWLPDSAFDDATLQRHSLVQLDAMARFQRATGQANMHGAWAGLQRLDVKLSCDEFDAEHSEAKADNLEEGRLKAIEQRLTDSPVVVITGLTGVGKSTTIEKQYAKRHSNMHYGEAEMLAWAKDRRPGRKTLFLDEANIGGNHWSILEGLYENPPFVRMGNDIVYVSEEHRVIAACNPVNYGDRKLPSLFERRGNALVFEPMSREYIYERMLKPLLSLTFEPAHMAEIAREFLHVYHFLCECSETSVLISPRELVMMARMTIAHNNPHNRAEDVARHYARLLTRDLVPKKHRADFDARFPPVSLHMRSYTQPAIPSAPVISSSSSTQPDKSQPPRFVVTPSREPLASLIEDLLNLREMGREMVSRIKPDEKDSESIPDDFLCGGLGGLIIEAAPGQGKSEMVKNLLGNRGYGNNRDKASFFIPASWHEDRKRKTLLEAFDMGAVVILDEINSCPMMEDFLNDLLTGKHPTEGKRRAFEPGFLLIGTQNPASMGGRQRTSNALMRRVISHKLPDYTQDEMMTILTECPVPGVVAALSRMRALHLMTIYRQNVGRGMVFRDVLKRAREIIKYENPELQMPDETFGFTLENLPQPARRPVPPELQSLFGAIADLRARGYELQNPDLHEATERQEGLRAVYLAARLEDSAWAFAENAQANREAFKTVLSTGFAEMSTHRNTLYPVLHKIWKAFQAILTFGIVVAWRGTTFFDIKTDRQRIIERAEKTLDRIANDGFTPVEPEESVAQQGTAASA